MDVDKILALIEPTHIARTVTDPHDLGRETFPLTKIVVADHQEFQYVLTSYIQHHKQTTGEGTPPAATAFGEARHILEQAFNKDQFQDGYALALQLALDGTQGGMRLVLNELAETLKSRALQAHMDYVFYNHVDVLSKADHEALSRAYVERFGTILRKFGDKKMDELTWAFNTRAALDYHRQLIEQIVNITKRF